VTSILNHQLGRGLERRPSDQRERWRQRPRPAPTSGNHLDAQDLDVAHPGHSEPLRVPLCYASGMLRKVASAARAARRAAWSKSAPIPQAPHPQLPTSDQRPDERAVSEQGGQRGERASPVEMIPFSQVLDIAFPGQPASRCASRASSESSQASGLIEERPNFQDPCSQSPTRAGPERRPREAVGRPRRQRPRPDFALEDHLDAQTLTVATQGSQRTPRQREAAGQPIAARGSGFDGVSFPQAQRWRQKQFRRRRDLSPNWRQLGPSRWPLLLVKH
jgi:hypothetical protein